MANPTPYAYFHTNTADAETVLRTGASPAVAGQLATGELGKVTINTSGAGTVTLRDSEVTGSGTSTIIAVVDTITAANTNSYIEFNVAFNRGLTYAKTGTADVTIVYR